jgi:signal transduction histidine kinase
MRELYGRYIAALNSVKNTAEPAGRRREAYFSGVLPLFGQIKSTADEILQMNQQNMNDANNQARYRASHARSQMYVLLVIGTFIAVAFIFFAGRWILRPIQRLIRSAEEIRRGNLDLVIQSRSRDEIGYLSESFNAMAASLREFRRTDQAKLLRIQRATQQAFDSLTDAVAVLDLEGRVEVATETAKNIFGLRPGSTIFDLPFGWMADLYSRAVKEGRRVTLEGPQKIIQQFLYGEERYYRPEAVPILDSERLPAGVILVLQDVTQLQQQDEIKRDVIRTVSHQLKTPLTSIRMAIHLLLEEKVGELNEKQVDLLLAAREDSDRLHEILANLLDISRIVSGKVQMELVAISPQTLVMDAIEPYRRSAQDQGVAINVELRGDLPDVRVDTTRVSHVFGNLLSNALKYTPPGGRSASPPGPRRTGSASRFPIRAWASPANTCQEYSSPSSVSPDRAKMRARVSAWPSLKRSSKPTAAKSPWKARRARGRLLSSCSKGPTEPPTRNIRDDRLGIHCRVHYFFWALLSLRPFL